MTIASPRRRKKPYNPALAEYQARVQSEEDAKKRDRKSRDLLRNAMVAPVDIVDPISGEIIVVFRSTRDDPLSEMLARGQISECDFAAGRHWQRAYEGAEIGNVCGIDPTKEAVDGGRMRDPISDRRDQAGRDLAAAGKALKNSNWLIISVLGTRKPLIHVAREMAGPKSYEGIYVALRQEFREALETLAVVFGLTNLTRA